MAGSRSQKSINNAIVSVASAMVIFLLNFVRRTVFIRILTREYLGMSGLFSNILSFLALAELGVGHAMNYALYRPLRENDTEKLKSLMTLYRKMYTAIGVVILVIGLSLTPFLHLLIKEMPESIPEIRLYYMIYVLRSAISYFFTYRRSLIVCDQKEYVAVLESLGISIASTVTELIILVRTHDYMLYLLTAVVFTIIGNLLISWIANRMYPFLREKDIKPLPGEDAAAITRNVSALFFHKLASVVVFSTDNIIISKFIGLVSVGLYSNYTMLIGGVKKLIGRLFSASMASVGNLMASDDKEASKKVFYRILFMNALLYGFSSSCLMCLMTPFIRLWAGESFVLPASVVIASAVSFYVTGMRQTLLVFKEAAGIFVQDRFKPIIEAFANLVISIPLAIRLGILGVILGTILSTLLVSFWFEAVVFFREVYGGGVSKYFYAQIRYALVNTAIAAAAFGLCSLIGGSGIAAFALRLLIAAILPLAVYFALYRKSDGFEYFKGIAFRFLARFKR